MIAYLANQIIIGNLTYAQVVIARADLKDKLDAYILANNLEIDKTA